MTNKSQDNDKRLILVALLITFLLVFSLWGLCEFLLRSSKSIPTGLVRYGGSTVWALIRKEVDPEIKNLWPKYELTYFDPPRSRGIPSSGVGISMLLDGDLDFVQSSRPISDKEYEEAKKRGISLEQIPIAIDGIAIVVNHNLNISNISQEQFCNIYAGKISNWKEIKESEEKITPYLKIGQKNPFCDNINEKAKHIQLVNTTTEALRKIATNPGGIYWSSASLLVPQCTVKSLLIRHSNTLVYPYKQPLVTPDKCNSNNHNKVNNTAFRRNDEHQYPLIRTLSVIIKKDGKFAQKSGEAYVKFLKKDTTKKLIQDSGMEPIN
ncbi:MAG: substrate-binding domain-containing protein [Crocosphaera sp.]|nr:substrate-binding domain-containing protein [Crocosphaera sp.]